MGDHHLLPIPTYEEATSSRATSEFGDNDDAEASRLLPQSSSSSSLPSAERMRRDGYRPPTVESVRSSVESSFLEEFASSRSSAESLQREIIQMEVMDAGMGGGEDGNGGGSGLRQSFSKRFISISSSLSAISLPRNPFRGFRFKLRMPKIPPLPCFANVDTATMMPVFRLFVVLLGAIIVYMLIATDFFNFSKSGTTEYLGPFEPGSVRSFADKTIDKNRIRHWLEYVSSFDHVAGTEGDYVLANYVEGQFKAFGFATQKVQYDVYLNYPAPGGRRVWMDDPKWEAQLEEPSVDKTHENTLVFHGYSKSGAAKGPLIYANYGAREDFKYLESLGVSVKGAIVLMRYGGSQSDRALKVKAAELAGAAGALIFSDPKVEGWDWPDTAVQRGSVSLMSWVVGDVLTPGYPSYPGGKRIPKENNPGLVNIPSLPLSYRDARPLLQGIEGKGKKPRDDWVGGVPDVKEYWTGSLDSSPVVNLRNDQIEKDRQPIWNVLGEIHGTDHFEEKIIIGNHRDAWCFGASDPGSGTAVMLEVARVFGEMMKFGWRPLRSIVFASWDAEEYNLIGSTEFVEEGGEDLKDAILAYINLDTAVAGNKFEAAGSPAMQSAMANVLGRVKDPFTNAPLNSTWISKEMPGLGAGSDYVAFQHHAGISSIDLAFSGKGFPYHSCYDNFEWMKNLGDPTFGYHEALAKVLIFLALDLADTAIIPFNMTEYANALDTYYADLKKWVQGKLDESSVKGKGKLDLKPLEDALAAAHAHINEFDGMKDDWLEKDSDGIYILGDEWSVTQRRSRSIRMGNFDKHLLDVTEGGGVPGREWFKHMIMSPQAWSGYDVGYFPGIRDAVDMGNWSLAQQEVQKVSTLLERASRKLLDELSSR